MAQTPFGDGPCCGGHTVIDYSDNGASSWAIEGDDRPGVGLVTGTSMGLVINDKTCSNNFPGDPNKECGPYWEWNGDGHEETVSSLFAQSTMNIPSNGVVFSITASIPNWSYYSSCAYNVSSTGCSYEYAPGGNEYGVSSSTPYDSAYFGLDNSSGFHVSVGFGEICNGSDPPCSSNAMEAVVFTDPGGTYYLQLLASHFFPSYTPTHTLTIETDRSTYFRAYIDNYLLYSSSTMPIEFSSCCSILLSQYTSIDNETSQVTWNNFSVYGSQFVTVQGLSSGMTASVTGPNGFAENATPSSGGVATVDVAPMPTGLTVSVYYNGNIIAIYSQPVDAGSVLDLTNT
jgi:hypothetical protein